MIKKWYNTDAAEMSAMVGITDEMIRSHSNGEVNNVYFGDEEGENESPKGSLEDTDIFGDIGEESLLMGHIELPVPVLNVQYLFGTNPILPTLLGMDRKDIDKVAYSCAYVVTEPGKSQYTYKQIIPPKDNDLRNISKRVMETEDGAVLMTGPAAIEVLLEKDGVKEKDNIILHTVPVMPFCMRYCKVADGVWKPYDLNYLYNRIILQVNRLKKLIKLNAPEIILVNEARMMQEKVDALINNGARGPAVVSGYAVPAESLTELNRAITSLTYKSVEPEMPDGYVPDKKSRTIKLLNEYKDFLKQFERDDDEPVMLSQKEADQEDKMLSDISESLIPFIKAVSDQYFSQYAEFTDEIVNSVRTGIERGLNVLEVGDESIEESLLYGIYGQIDYWVRKRSMFG